MTTTSKITTGYICPTCNGPAPLGFGLAGSAVPDERAEEVTHCPCGSSYDTSTDRTPNGRARWTHQVHETVITALYAPHGLRVQLVDGVVDLYGRDLQEAWENLTPGGVFIVEKTLPMIQ